jgi:hypothetical protein
MGSFRLAIYISYDHNNSNFTKLVLKTIKQSLRHSCTSELTRQGISLHYDRQSYSRRFMDIIKFTFINFILLPSIWQTSDIIHLFSILQCLVFLLNSRYFQFFFLIYLNYIINSLSLGYRVNL